MSDPDASEQILQHAFSLLRIVDDTSQPNEVRRSARQGFASLSEDVLDGSLEQHERLLTEILNVVRRAISRGDETPIHLLIDLGRTMLWDPKLTAGVMRLGDYALERSDAGTLTCIVRLASHLVQTTRSPLARVRFRAPGRWILALVNDKPFEQLDVYVREAVQQWLRDRNNDVAGVWDMIPDLDAWERTLSDSPLTAAEGSAGAPTPGEAGEDDVDYDRLRRALQAAFTSPRDSKQQDDAVSTIAGILDRDNSEVAAAIVMASLEAYTEQDLLVFNLLCWIHTKSTFNWVPPPSLIGLARRAYETGSMETLASVISILDNRPWTLHLIQREWVVAALQADRDAGHRCRAATLAEILEAWPSREKLSNLAKGSACEECSKLRSDTTSSDVEPDAHCEAHAMGGGPMSVAASKRVADARLPPEGSEA